MPTIFTHAMVPVVLGVGMGAGSISRRLVLAGMAASVLPDLDVIAFQFGIPYGSALAHRGFSHSLAMAAILGLAAALAHRMLQAGFARVFLFVGLAGATHGLLDACTNGGSAIALLWPFSMERFFAPVTPIEVSPIGLSRFLTWRGVAVFGSELLWVWLPCAGLALAMIAVRRLRRRD
jgi:inner membrane protein